MKNSCPKCGNPYSNNKIVGWYKTGINKGKPIVRCGKCKKKYPYIR